jgi:hypothetical protein
MPAVAGTLRQRACDDDFVALGSFTLGGPRSSAYPHTPPRSLRRRRRTTA